MRDFDRDFVSDSIARLRSIPENTTPQWGELNKAHLIEHLIWAVRHSMGKSQQVPYFGGFMTCWIAGPLMTRGIIRIPKNLKFPKHLTDQGITAREPGDLDALQQLLEEYVTLVQADELKPAPHPVFGDIGVDGWARMHALHLEHHCKQFGV